MADELARPAIEGPHDHLPDDALVYLCDPEWCGDDGMHQWGDPGHITQPYPFQAWRITDLKEEWDVYGDDRTDTYCLPANEGTVAPIVAWRMPCGAWRTTPPILTTVMEARRVLEAM